MTDPTTHSDEIGAVESDASEAGRHRRSPTGPWTLGAIVAVPLVLAAIVLAFRPWFPTLDMAMTELRVRDVGGRNTPLIGLPGRIGDFPDQGSHPGPWSFWLIRPFHLLSGGRAWGLELGSVVVNVVAVLGALAIARRIERRHRVGGPGVGGRGLGGRGVGGGVLVLATAGVLAVAIRGYGLSVLTHPWNPYFPLLLWLVVLLATWAVLSGDHRMAIVVVAVGTVAAQTHVPYLLPAVAMSAVAVLTLVRRRDASTLVAAVVVGVVLWFPAFVDQIRREPGNISMLIDHFTGDTDEAPIGFVTGTGVFLRHLDLPRAGYEMLRGDQAFLEVSGTTSGLAVGGLTVFVAWLASVVFAVRSRHAPLLRLHTILAVALAVGWFSMTRIFGKIWYYLTLWAWGTALLVAVAIAWTLVIVLRTWFDELHIRQAVSRVAWVVILIPTVLSLAAVPSLQVPEENLSSGLGGVVDATEQALRDGAGDAVGADGRYVVFWQDSNFIGAQGYGLLNELERRGFDVGVHETWRVPVTPQRVFPQGTYDAEVHLVSGAYIDEWRQRPGYVEVAYDDPRTPDEREEFEQVRERVLDRLDEIGRSDIADIVDVNLFGASLDPDLPADVVADLDRMLVLTAPVAVFVAPAGSTN